MNLPNILIAGNSIIDLVFRAKAFDTRLRNDRLSLALGGKYVVDEFHEFIGGGANNFAVSLSRQGFKTYLWTKIGNDTFAKNIIININKEGIDDSLINFDANRTPISTVLLTHKGERTIFTYRSNADVLDLNQKVINTMKKCTWFCLVSLPKCPKKIKLLYLKKAKDLKLKILLSLHGSEYAKGYTYLKDYFSYCDLLHLNAYELSTIIGTNINKLNLPKTNYSKKLKIPLLLVSYDIFGSYCYTPQSITYQPTIKPKQVIDVTGAGDAFASGFLGEYIKTDSLEKALFFAAQNAKSEIEVLGAQNGLLKKKD